MDKLYDKLVSYSRQGDYPMHMPGHKRNTKLLPMGNPYEIDITEIEGFDNLHQPEGLLRQLSERIRSIYHAGKSYCLINGSTAGILAGISAAVDRGDRILVARNCHKSVYHAILMMQLKPVYIYPEMVEDFFINGGILTEKIEKMLIKYSDIRLVVITSPTYEGVVSDIRRIAEIVHAHGGILLVDEAHGAHLGFHEGFPDSAVSLGADVVIQSLHKTLPALTQTGVLHCNRPALYQKIEGYLSIYQTSSPSYVLMAGIDRCISLLETEGKILFDSFYKELLHFYHTMEELTALKLFTGRQIGNYAIFGLDPSKITISVKNLSLTGHQLNQILRNQYHIVAEMEARDYVLAMTSICDTGEGFESLSKALLAIDCEVVNFGCEVVNFGCGGADFDHDTGKRKAVLTPPIQVIPPYEAWEGKSVEVTLKDSFGKVSAGLVCLYPPGIPLLVPGEMIGEDHIAYIERALKEGFVLSGLQGESRETPGIMVSLKA